LKDPLSALDAHVGKAVFHNVLQNALTGKTRILVTHALHFLPQVDYIYVVAGGRVAEHGTYADLMATENGEFARFVNEFGSKDEDKKEDIEGASEEAEKENEDSKKKSATRGAALMQAEERVTGAVGWSVYKVYLSAARAIIVLPILILSVALMQGTNVMASYW
jgi:ABC-type multidrug transport system ATPase subunit